MPTGKHLTTPKDEIIDSITQDPVVCIGYYATPEGARAEEVNTVSYGILPEPGGFRLWSVEDETWELDDMGFFETYDLAKCCAEERSRETAHILQDWLQTQMEEAWEAEVSSAIEVVAPFTFWSNTDFRHGRELESEEDLFAFLDGHRLLEEDTPWGNAYQCSLRDDNGVDFWVKKGPRGEMRIVGTGMPG